MLIKKLRVGNIVNCLYPKNGVKNILTRQKGRIERIAKNGTWVTLEREDGSYRTLSASKMVNATVVS
jgi:muconolactone delta-isomerase